MIKKKHGESKKIKGWLIGGILLLFLGGGLGWKWYSQQKSSAPQIEKITIKKAKRKKQSSAKKKSSSESKKEIVALTYNGISPAQTAMAIAYYGESYSGQDTWQNLFSNDGNLNLTQREYADHLSVPGRGRSWLLQPAGATNKVVAAYTVGADGNVAFYSIDPQSQQEYSPFMQVNLRKIIMTVNKHEKSQAVIDKAQNLAIKTVTKQITTTDKAYSNEEYELMAYMQLVVDNGDGAEKIADDVQKLEQAVDYMHWQKQDGGHSIDAGAHATTMRVQGDQVYVTYDTLEGDHMGIANGHKTYSKAELVRNFGEYSQQIKNILSKIHRVDN